MEFNSTIIPVFLEKLPKVSELLTRPLMMQYYAG